MKSSFFRSASLRVSCPTTPITSVLRCLSSCPGTSTQYWKKKYFVPLARLPTRTFGFCPSLRDMHLPRLLAGTGGDGNDSTLFRPLCPVVFSWLGTLGSALPTPV